MRLAAAALLLCACGKEGVQVVALTSPPGGEIWAGVQIDSALIAIGRGGVYRSVDGGNRWARQGATPGQPRSRLTRIYNAQVYQSDVFLNADGEVLRSKDTGRSWASVFGSNAQVFVAGDRLYAIQGTYLLRSHDGGSTWPDTLIHDVSRGREVPIAAFADVLLGPSSSWIYFSDGQTAWRSIDGGAHWEAGQNATPYGKNVTTSGVPLFHAAIGSVLYSLDLEGNLFQSHDVGDTWDRMPGRVNITHFGILRLLSVGDRLWITNGGVSCPMNPISAGCDGTPPLPPVFNFIGASGRVAATAHGIWRSPDGLQWQQTSHGLPARVTAAATADSIRYIAADGGIYRGNKGSWVRGVITTVDVTDLWTAEGRLFALTRDTLISCSLGLDSCERRSISSSTNKTTPKEWYFQTLELIPRTIHVNKGRFYLAARTDPGLMPVVLRSDDLGKTWHVHVEIPGNFVSADQEPRWVERLWMVNDELHVLTSTSIYAVGARGNRPPRNIGEIPQPWIPSTSALAGSDIFIGTTEGTLVKLAVDDTSVRITHVVSGGSSIRSLWVSPKNARAVVAATDSGIVWSGDGGQTLHRVPATVSHEIGPPVLLDAGNDLLLASGPGGLVQLKEQITQLSPVERALQKLWKWTVGSSWLQRSIAFVLTVLSGYVIALVVTLFRGRIHFDRWWGKPVGVLVRHLPKRAIWAIFARYRKRLQKMLRAIEDAYYPLPATAPDGSEIPPDNGLLIAKVGHLVAVHRLVWVVGPGGAGKSTVLERIAWEVVGRSAPAQFGGLYPILVSAEDFNSRGNLIGAIASALAQRHRVPLPDDILQALLSSGRFLVLIDGISEIDHPDVEDPSRAIIRAAKHLDLAECRFVLASRYAPGDSDSVIQLEPLAPEYIRSRIFGKLIPEVRSDVERQLVRLGGRPVPPLLLAMMVKAAQSGDVSRTIANLYERYFARLLDIRRDQTEWQGWAVILSALAKRSLIETGKRGKGLRHIGAINVLNSLKLGEVQVVEDLEGLYGIRGVKNALKALRRLQGANILAYARDEWRFRHDRFEEYFAALHLVEDVRLTETWPSLDKWRETEEKQREFVDVLQFAAELDDDAGLIRTIPADYPDAWRSALNGTPPGEPPDRPATA
jgi:hypothetical protein